MIRLSNPLLPTRHQNWWQFPCFQQSVFLPTVATFSSKFFLNNSWMRIDTVPVRFPYGIPVSEESFYYFRAPSCLTLGAFADRQDTRGILGRRNNSWRIKWYKSDSARGPKQADVLKSVIKDVSIMEISVVLVQKWQLAIQSLDLKGWSKPLGSLGSHAQILLDDLQTANVDVYFNHTESRPDQMLARIFAQSSLR